MSRKSVLKDLFSVDGSYSNFIVAYLLYMAFVYLYSVCPLLFAPYTSATKV